MMATLLVASSPVFYDFEASALDGCPIEIGWAWWDGTIVKSESHLILPDPTWDIESSWDDRAEALHGITLKQLKSQGEPAFNVARHLNEAVGGRELFADSPFDVDWLSQLFEVAGSDPAFELRLMLAPVLIEQLRVKLGIPEAEASPIMTRIKQEYPHTHRAEADARQWAEIWRAILEYAPNDRSP